MGSHAVVGDSPFLKRVLIPFWILRILIMGIEAAMYGLALGVILTYADDLDRLEREYGVKNAVVTVLAMLGTILFIILLCLVLDLVCIIKRARRTLSPKFFLIVNVVQTTFWTVMFILSMIGARTGVTIGLAIFVYATFAGLLIYASVMFHKDRKGTLGGNKGHNNVQKYESPA